MEQDDAEVAKWFRKAAEQGDSGVQYSLGLCYDEGQGVGQDEVEAGKWCQKAAEQRNSNATRALALWWNQWAAEVEAEAAAEA